MNTDGTLRQDSDSSFGAPPPQGRSTDRTMLISVSTFEWLRNLQVRSPQPRIDMRYLIDGTLAVVAQTDELRSAWQAAGRQALLAHLAHHDTTNSGVRAQPAADGAAPHQGSEGAQARISGAASREGRHEGCRALQISVSAYRRLRDMQQQTHEPRLDFRFLMTGAHEFLALHPELLPDVIARARLALRDHLTELHSIPIAPFSLETQR
ncbi:MAG: hypothetical protein QM750_20135 [Rubrivivax sp.]